MNKALLFNTILLIIITSVIFFSNDYHKIYALNNNNNNNSTTIDLTFSLPFNSHFADQAIHQKDYSVNAIPFP